MSQIRESKRRVSGENKGVERDKSEKRRQPRHADKVPLSERKVKRIPRRTVLERALPGSVLFEGMLAIRGIECIL